MAGCLSDVTQNNRIAGDYSPAAVSYSACCLHCKNAAISAPPNLMCTSQSEWRIIQMMSTAVTQIMAVLSSFCDIALASFWEKR